MLYRTIYETNALYYIGTVMQIVQFFKQFPGDKFDRCLPSHAKSISLIKSR